jgi:hypothetical protein
MEPVFAPRDRRLDDDVLVPRVNADLRRRAPFTATRGRPSTPVEVLLRRLVAGGLLSGSRILAEAGPDFPSRPDRRAAQAQRVGRPPQWLAADRGV